MRIATGQEEDVSRPKCVQEVRPARFARSEPVLLDARSEVRGGKAGSSGACGGDRRI